ncbi:MULTISPECIES: helix-turn-helix transcriptional regulator [unclassified Paenibacillus]|uniref:helix-turn-helix transcriptional regulator n=1 Tax=unclassified Paenibacillus TaxID=185978 RepID=UPI003642AD12
MYWKYPDTILKFDGLTAKRFRKDHFYMDDHFHSWYEITYLLDGSRHFFIKDKKYVLKKGDLVFIAPNDIHRSLDANPSEYEKIELGFDLKWISRARNIAPDFEMDFPFHQDIRILRLTLQEQEYVESILTKVMHEIMQEQYGFQHEAAMLLTQLLMFSTRLYQLPSQQQPQTSPGSDNITNMIRYINDNYMEKLYLENIASKFHFNPSYLSYRFKEVTGISFVDYVNSVRIQEAKKLLVKSNSPVTEVAMQCGFTNLTHFGRVFKGLTGITPTLFRRNYNVPIGPDTR